jgi:hypothetical protein
MEIARLLDVADEARAVFSAARAIGRYSQCQRVIHRPDRIRGCAVEGRGQVALHPEERLEHVRIGLAEPSAVSCIRGV